MGTKWLLPSEAAEESQVSATIIRKRFKQGKYLHTAEIARGLLTERRVCSGCVVDPFDGHKSPGEVKWHNGSHWNFDSSVVRWLPLAACVGVHDKYKIDFFPVPEKEEKVAQQVWDRFCSGCEVKSRCLDSAKDEEFGIWAGTTPAQRQAGITIQQVEGFR